MATVYKRGKSWYLSWVDEAGRRHRESLGPVSAPDARASLAHLKLRLIKNPHGVVPAPTLEEFSKSYLQWYKIQYPSSYDRVSRIFSCHLVKEFGSQPLNLIDLAVVMPWRNDRIEEAATDTVNKELKTLKACLQRAVDWGVIDFNPLDKGVDSLFLPKRADKKPVFYTAEQLAKLYAVSSKRNAALWKFMANTGIRRAEMLALTWEAVGGDRVTIISTEDSPTKGRKTRVVPLNTAAQEAAQALRNIGEDATHVLRRMTLRSLSRCFLLNAGKAGLPGSIHCLRHTFCAQLVMAHIPLRTVQVLAGHASIKTTEIYAHLAPDYLANAVTAISL